MTVAAALASKSVRAVWVAWALGAVLAACAPQGAGRQGAGPGDGPGGPFHLVNQDGREVDQRVLNGKWSLVFFGYTFCPDECPTTLTALGQAMKDLGPKASQAQVVFITVDPARDTPRAMKAYLSSPAFPRNAIGLTGTPAEIAQVAKAYVVYYRKDGDGSNYAMDHSTAIYLMNPSGRFDRVIAEGLTPAQDAQQISQAIASS
jgi:protein SCO1/2